MRRWLRRRVERHPLLGCAGLAAAAVVAADGWNPGWGLALLALGLIVWAGKARAALGFATVAVVAAGLHGADAGRRKARREALPAPMSATARLRIIGEPREAGRGWVMLAATEDSGERFWLWTPGMAPRRHSVVAVEGRIEAVEGPRNPGEFDRRPWLDRQGVAAAFHALGPVREVVPPAPWRTAGETLRASFRESVTRGLDPLSREAAVIRAVALGEHPDDDVLIEPFRRSGTLHLFAVSGLHVGMVGLLGWLVLRPFGLSRRMAVLPVVAMMFGYAWLTGMKPPAVRAAWMAAVVLGAFAFRRRPDAPNALGMAALLVVLGDGDLLFQAGVQLSFGVVLAITGLHGWVGRAFGWMTRTEPYLPRALYGPWRAGWLGLRRKVAGMLTVSGSAWFGSAPLTAWYFGLLTPVAILASSLMFVFVFPLLGLALLSAVLSPVPRASAAINGLNRHVADLTLRVAGTAAEVPGGNVAIPRGRPAGEFLVVYDLGEGGAACFHDRRATALVDAGGRREFRWVVLPSLRRLAVKPEVFAVTHADGAHAGGLVEALDAFALRQGLMPVIRARSGNYRTLLEAAECRGVRLVRGRVGTSYRLSEHAALHALAEPDAWNWDAVADERVMPLRLEWRGWRVLFLGDAGRGAGRAMLGSDLAADVVVLGHHEFDDPPGMDFLAATGARAVIMSHADFPASERVPEAWRRACEARGIAVFHQGESGAVTLTAEGGILRLEGFVDRRVLELEPQAGLRRRSD